MYNDQLVYKVVMWVVFVISLWKEKEPLIFVILKMLIIYYLMLCKLMHMAIPKIK